MAAAKQIKRIKKLLPHIRSVMYLCVRAAGNPLEAGDAAFTWQWRPEGAEGALFPETRAAHARTWMPGARHIRIIGSHACMARGTAARCVRLKYLVAVGWRAKEQKHSEQGRCEANVPRVGPTTAVRGGRHSGDESAALLARTYVRTYTKTKNTDTSKAEL